MVEIRSLQPASVSGKVRTEVVKADAEVAWKGLVSTVELLIAGSEGTKGFASLFQMKTGVARKPWIGE